MHRATRNCYHVGLVREDTSFLASNLTSVYSEAKAACGGDFSDVGKYQHIVDRQLEKMYISNSDVTINPIMFVIKILLLLGDAVGQYKISIEEFRLFVATAQRWSDYFEVIESIIRFRSDDKFKEECKLIPRDELDTRYNILAANHSLIVSNGNNLEIKEGCIKQARKIVAEYEISDVLDFDADLKAKDLYGNKTEHSHSDLPSLQTIFYGCPGTGKSHMVEKILKSASKGVVKVAETAENRSLNFHQYLKEQPYFRTGDAYHFAIKSQGKKSLCNVIKERGLAGDIDSCFDITDVATLKKIHQSIKENNPFLPQHQEPVYALEYYIKFLEEKPKVQLDTEFRTTFHPDSDYASFVGCYKPTMIEGENDENRISYAFVPQVFTNAYVRAWELYNSGSKENVYLVIEEINRGNCAQIFGDLFQLLDRYEDGEKTGFSKYKVDPDADLSEYLVGIFDKHDCAKKLCLPPNLIILATMNTSDQSLFPMDSAFKRRWSWKYVPIDYEHEDSSKFTITIGDRSYSWNKFLQDVNERIKTITQSEDKQIGNFFIAHADIKQDEFINKVMFYLWSEICKDNYKTRDNFFRNRNNKDEEFSFNDLFGKGATALLQGFMAYIAGEDAVVEEEAQEVQEVNG